MWSTTALIISVTCGRNADIKVLKGQFNKLMNLEEIAAK